ncbi:competence protein ComK [Oceanobacillus iheyensis]|uniref:competence protein ComK n=1 Tax=Oceanobacillus iheyensis TaxID=182710 RepID=UPI00362788DD
MTMAIYPTNKPDVSSVILEQRKSIEHKQTPLQLIKEGCLYHYSTYEGRKAATTYHTGFKRKIPIVISVSHQIIAFPTHANTNNDCNWIFYHHVQTIQSQTTTDKTKSIITFRNGIQLPLSIPAAFLRQQMNRSLACYYSLSK